MLTTTRNSAHEISASSVQNRTAWACFLLLGVALLSVSRWLTPNVHGLGTHTQLHLPPCGFHALTGLPCPACGLTTSFAYLADGEWLKAFDAHSLGPALFAMVCGGVLVAGAGCVMAWPVGPTFARFKAVRVAVVLAVMLGVSWLMRLARLLLA